MALSYVDSAWPVGSGFEFYTFWLSSKRVVSIEMIYDFTNKNNAETKRILKLTILILQIVYKITNLSAFKHTKMRARFQRLLSYN